MAITIETHESIAPVAAEWDALAEQVDAPPFLRPGWIASWHRSFGAGRLLVVCARRGRGMVGVVPVVQRLGAISSPTNWHTPLFRPLAADSEVTAALIGAVLGRRPRRLDFSFLDLGDKAFSDCVNAAKALRHQPVSRVVQRSPYIEIESDWTSFESELPSRRRSKMRRFRRRLEEQGSVAIGVEHGTHRLDALLAEGFAVEASGWKGERGTSILASPKTARFYREVAAWAAAEGWLRLWFLRLDEKAIAFAYCLEQGGAHYELKVGFDPEFRRFGPGVLLTRAKLEHCFSAGLGSYEFLGQAERHKLDWTEDCRELARLQVFAPTVAGRASRIAWTHGRDLALRVRRSLGARR